MDRIIITILALAALSGSTKTSGVNHRCDDHLSIYADTKKPDKLIDLRMRGLSAIKKRVLGLVENSSSSCSRR